MPNLARQICLEHQSDPKKEVSRDGLHDKTIQNGSLLIPLVELLLCGPHSIESWVRGWSTLVKPLEEDAS